MKLLFVCSRNRLRSPTAEAIFTDDEGMEVASAGTSVDSDTFVSADLVEWADIIFAMERVHQRRLLERFGSLLKAKRVVVLGIPDVVDCIECQNLVNARNSEHDIDPLVLTSGCDEQRAFLIDGRD